MRAAAELLAEGVHGDDAHLFAVFIAEERESALGDRVLNAHDLGPHPLISLNLAVDDRFDLIDVP